MYVECYMDRDPPRASHVIAVFSEPDIFAQFSSCVEGGAVSRDLAAAPDSAFSERCSRAVASHGSHREPQRGDQNSGNDRSADPYEKEDPGRIRIRWAKLGPGPS